MKMILIDALYINNSGGKILLNYLIQELEKTSHQIIYLLDSRIKGNHPVISGERVYYTEPGIVKRHGFYRKYGYQFDKILCFASIPPSIRLKGVVYVYFHQFLYLDIPARTPLKKTILLFLKQNFIKRFKKKADHWIVQTEYNKEALKTKFVLNNKQVSVIPFYPQFPSNDNGNKKKNAFIYVSGPNLHKNHMRLLKAFKNFYLKTGSGELHLTIENNEMLLNYIEAYVQQGIPIINHGFVDRSEISELYASIPFVIYPSLAESFGLGLIEGMECRCNVIGADLPYTYAVCDPSLSFDPLDTPSIENALMKAYNNEYEPTHQKISNQIDELVKTFT